MGDVPPKNSKELANAIYDDYKRSVVDATKKRAVAQRVDYETFKNMVSVAHLRPLQAPSTREDTTQAPAWQLNADGTRMPVEQCATPELTANFPEEPPSTSTDFMRDWRRSLASHEGQYNYLKMVGGQRLAKLFRVEMSGELLGQVIKALDAGWPAACERRGSRNDSDDQEVAFLLDSLASLTATGRFTLTSRLLSRDSKQALHDLLDRLQTFVENGCGSEEEVAADGATPQDLPMEQRLPVNSRLLSQLGDIRCAFGIDIA